MSKSRLLNSTKQKNDDTKVSFSKLFQMTAYLRINIIENAWLHKKKLIIKDGKQLRASSDRHTSHAVNINALNNKHYFL